MTSRRPREASDGSANRSWLRWAAQEANLLDHCGRRAAMCGNGASLGVRRGGNLQEGHVRALGRGQLRLVNDEHLRHSTDLEFYDVGARYRFVPYVEIAGSGGGTDLEIPEIKSAFAFLLFGGLGASVFVSDKTALYLGYRFQHVSNGDTSKPNRGFESNVVVGGVSFYLP